MEVSRLTGRARPQRVLRPRAPRRRAKR